MPQAETRESLAHSVLSRYLPTLTRVITTASFCHLYRGALSASTSSFSWEKKDLGGSTFLCATRASPDAADEYHLVILNRLGINNFIWTLASTECIEDDGVHLVFNSRSGLSRLPVEPGYEIDDASCYGIWVFPNPSVADERDKMLAAVMNCARQAEEQSKKEKKKEEEASPPPPQRQQELGGYSIMSQVFPCQPQQAQYSIHTPPPPQNGGDGDVLGRLFESARQRGTGTPGY